MSAIQEESLKVKDLEPVMRCVTYRDPAHEAWLASLPWWRLWWRNVWVGSRFYWMVWPRWAHLHRQLHDLYCDVYYLGKRFQRWLFPPPPPTQEELDRWAIQRQQLEQLVRALEGGRK